MTNETCPHCDARRFKEDEFAYSFECGTISNKYSVVQRSQYCRTRQIARLQEALKSLLEVEELECRFDHQGHCQSHYLDLAINGCRVAKARKLL